MLFQALLDYERHKTRGGELTVPVSSHSEPINVDAQVNSYLDFCVPSTKIMYFPAKIS